MKIGVLAAADSWYARDLVRAAGNRHNVTPLRFTALGVEMPGAISPREEASRPAAPVFYCGDQPLAELDALLVRTMPPGSLEQVVFRMDLLARMQQQGILVLNPPKAIEAAVDKYLSLALLAQAGLPTPMTVVCQTVEQAMDAYLRLGGRAVVKPLFGSEGRGMTRVDDEAIALRVFKTLVGLGAVLYLQEYIDHPGYDDRLFVLGSRVFGIRRHNPADWRTNVSRGAIAQPLTPTSRQIEIAVRAAAAVGAEMAGVDLLTDRAGNGYVIEVNAVPGWQALAKTLSIDIAAEILDFVAAR